MSARFAPVVARAGLERGAVSDGLRFREEAPGIPKPLKTSGFFWAWRWFSSDSRTDYGKRRGLDERRKK
jgi:hypothetical protein